MKTSFVFSFSAVVAASTAVAELTPPPRQLQFFPQGNNQNALRPNQGGLNGLQGQFGFPAQGNGFNQGAFPVNGQMMGQQQNFGAGAGAGEADVTSAGLQQNFGAGAGAGEADVTSAAAGSTAGAQPQDTATTPGVIAPGQPTIMVILPDSMAAHSGWGSHADDVGETKTPMTEAPKPEETPKSASNDLRGVVAMLAVAVASVATALALN